MDQRFYVYEHTRNDTGAVFYVGKGSERRAWVRQGRNNWWRRIADKSGYQVRIVVPGIEEELAHMAEMERIDQLRRIGVQLCNLTDGGEGMSGYKAPPEVIERRSAKQRGQKRLSVSEKLRGRAKTEEHRKKLAEARRGKKASQAAREAMSRARKGQVSSMKGKRHSEETKAKISAAVSGENAPFLGRSHTPETIERIRLANLGRKESAETRAKKSAARIGDKNPRFGVTIPEDQKLRQIASLKARPRVTCPHCNKTMDESNAKRWHMDNCRSKK